MSAFFRRVFNGALIGCANLVPGVSGGKVALALGELEPLLSGLNGLAADRERRGMYLVTLIPLVFGAAGGLLLCSKGILFLKNAYPLPVLAALEAILLFRLPGLMKSARQRGGLRPGRLLLFLGGTGLALAIHFAGIRPPAATLHYTFLDALALCACMAAAGGSMMLPGLSGAMVLLMLGQYATAVSALANLDLMRLLPMGIGAVAGWMLVAGFLDELMRRRGAAVYWTASGLALGAVAALALDTAALVPHASDREWILASLTFVLTGTLVLLLEAGDLKAWLHLGKKEIAGRQA